ncbi:MAG: hypothetical protein ABI539_13745 [Acidobacteriota bacterium]
MVTLSRLLFILFIFSVGVTAQTKPSDDPKGVEIYLARDDGSGKAGEAESVFGINDVPIYCVVQLASDKPVTVKMNLVAVDVPGVKPETHVVSTTYTTKDNQDRVNFTGRPHGKWVAGKYRVDVFVEDQPAGSVGFSVQKTLALPKKLIPEGIVEQPNRPKPKIAGRLTKS